MQATSSKSLREQLTVAYENKVAETKATRDPRLIKGKNPQNTINCITRKNGKDTPILTPSANLPTNTSDNYLTLTLTYLLAARTLPDLKIVPETEVVRVPKQAPKKATSYADAPLLNLKDLLPPDLVPDNEDLTLDTTFRATRLEFVVLSFDSDDVLLDPGTDDDDMEWGIPTQEVFDDVVARAVNIFTKDNPDLILSFCLLYTSPSPRD